MSKVAFTPNPELRPKVAFLNSNCECPWSEGSFAKVMFVGAWPIRQGPDERLCNGGVQTDLEFDFAKDLGLAAPPGCGSESFNRFLRLG